MFVNFVFFTIVFLSQPPAHWAPALVCVVGWGLFPLRSGDHPVVLQVQALDCPGEGRRPRRARVSEREHYTISYYMKYR